jgi:hypothetical protein
LLDVVVILVAAVGIVLLVFVLWPRRTPDD